MDYLLDTDICIDLINRRAAWWERLADRITAVKRGRVLLSALTVAELRYGVAKSPSPDKNRLALDTFLIDFEVVAFDSGSSSLRRGSRDAGEKGNANRRARYLTGCPCQEHGRDFCYS